MALNQYEIKDFDDMKSIDAIYQFSPRDSLNYIIKDDEKYIYTATLYKEFNYTNNIDFYKGSMLDFDNTPRKKNDYLVSIALLKIHIAIILRED